MAIEKEYTLKLSTKQAQENVDELNQSLKLQESLIDDLEKEIRQYEKQLDKTSKTDLAAQKKIKDALKAKKEALKDEKIALKDLNKDRKKECNIKTKYYEVFMTETLLILMRRLLLQVDLKMQ